MLLREITNIRRVSLDKKSVIRWKIYIDRARMYIGYINFFMIGIVFLKSIENTWAGQLIVNNQFISFPIIFISFLLFSLVLGFIDSKMGLRAEEMRNAASSNPVMMEILQTLKKIEEKQDNLNTREETPEDCV